MPRPVEYDDLTRCFDIDRVQFSPDGKLLALQRSIPDAVSNTYLREVLIGEPAGPFQTVDTGYPGRTSQVSWSPDSGRIAVVVRTDSGWAILAGAVIPGGTVPQWDVVASDLPDAVQELVFSPDGAFLLFVVREPVDRDWWSTPEDRRAPLRLTDLRYREDGVGWTVNTRRQAYVVPADAGAAPARVSDGGHDDAQFSWHPDGGSVYFVSQRHPEWDRSPLNDVFRQRVSQGLPVGEAERLTSTNAEHAFPVPSPEGTRLSFASVDVAAYPASQHLAVLDLETRTTSLVTAQLDRDTHADSVRWQDESRLSVVVDRSGRMELVEFDVSSGDFDVVVGGDFRVTAFDRRGDRLAVVRSGPAEPPHLLTGSRPDLREAYQPNSGPAADWELAVPQYVPVQVADGTTVDAWLARPVGAAGSLPVILWLQGGGTQFGYQWSHEVQMLCSAGYAVLYVNARGSAGYGTDWMRAVNGTRAEHPGSGWGVVDVADVSAVVEAVLAGNEDLDRTRVGVMGGSYGGLMVTHLLGQTELFRVGWAERGPYNLFSDAGTKDEAPWFFEAYLGADHLQDTESYWAASPMRVVRGITAPLIIVHSENDFRCTIGQAEELFMALKLLGREVEFVRFPGEGHSLTRSGSPVHRLQRSQILLEWFGKHPETFASPKRLL